MMKKSLRTRPRARSRIAGFTLVETLIATALMAAILAAIATITAQWLPNWNRGFARVQRNEALALGIERIVADLAAAQYVTAGREFFQPVFDGNLLSVTFVRPSFGPNSFPGLEVVRIAETAAGQGRVLVRARTAFVPVVSGVNDRDPANFTDPVVLVRDPYRVSFSYAGADRVWKDTWRNADQLPHSIRVTLRDAATERTLSVSTATTVHADLPAKCVMEKETPDCIGPSKSAAPQGPAGAGAGANNPAAMSR
jgi:general secretion pathway protein J